MNGARLARSLELLRAVNEARRAWHHVPGCACGCDVVGLSEEALAQHDADARDGASARQLSIFDALRAQKLGAPSR